MSEKIDLKLVKELRDQTQAPISKCKEALESCSGDISKAKNWLRERAMVYAAKKSDRATENGSSVLVFNENKNKAAIIVLRCETDFVAKNEQFTQLAVHIANEIVNKFSDCQLNSEQFGNVIINMNDNNTDNNMSVLDVIKQHIGIMGENIIPVSASVMSKNNDEIFESYVHNSYVPRISGKRAAVVKIKSNDNTNPIIQKLARDMVVHIVVAAPKFLSFDQIKDKEEHEDSVLLEQKYAMDGSTKISSMIEEAGYDAKITGFIFASVDNN
ncbi:translation elongation factor Ts [Lyticum sinuosum]|uniref:Elongation factor Ts n=1 Tax=Lyticum sinuosum TaxID=1332059 RepID=A0AAE4VMD3_9RICK|nr:translation elongation factor Ts [Lyticum sinuosum]MDZ5761636.1 Elongation factor Ts [Lyticum sinuosum]